MWYEMLIKDEFIEYFSNDNNVFYTVENGKDILAPTFLRFSNIIAGIVTAWTFNDLPTEKLIGGLRSEYTDIIASISFCKTQIENEKRTLASIWHSIPHKLSPYDADINDLNAEQCAVSLIYPFLSGMGGSFELQFQQDGRLKKYLLALKEKSTNKK